MAGFTICVLSVFTIFAPAVTALPIMDAAARATLNSVPLTPVSDTDTVEATASIVDPDGEYAGRGASDSSGRLAASADFYGASGTRAIIEGEATWTETFDSSAGASAIFDFFIPGAAIGFWANNVPGLIGSYNVDILFNGTSVFNAYSEVQTLVGTPVSESDLSLTQSGTVLNASFASDVAPGFGGNEAGYRFDPFNGSLDLTAIDGTNTISYSMYAVVDGLIGETSAIASIGDPLNLSQQPAGVTLTSDTDTPPGPAPVPEPATMLLFGTGFLGLAAARRKFKK